MCAGHRVDVNRVIALTRDAKPFEFVVNPLNDSELAGACFSPDSRTLFFDIFGDAEDASGMTWAVTDPWHNGPPRRTRPHAGMPASRLEVCLLKSFRNADAPV